MQVASRLPGQCPMFLRKRSPFSCYVHLSSELKRPRLAGLRLLLPPACSTFQTFWRGWCGRSTLENLAGNNRYGRCSAERYGQLRYHFHVTWRTCVGTKLSLNDVRQKISRVYDTIALRKCRLSISAIQRCLTTAPVSGATMFDALSNS